MFNEKIYFDMVRGSLFGGEMVQGQVDGQRFILASWDRDPTTTDLRWLGYSLATTFHETSKTMLPIEEYGKGSGRPYGKIDPETKQAYYGRGFVQLTWRDNYVKATRELGLTGENDLEWHAEKALDPNIAADIMFLGMAEGWFRGDKDGRQTLGRYFNATTDNAYGAREIINGDKTHVPKWSNNVPIGWLVAGYHDKFWAAVTASYVETPPVVEPKPEPNVVAIDIVTTGNPFVIITVNGKPLS